jgi:cytochrome c1
MHFSPLLLALAAVLAGCARGAGEAERGRLLVAQYQCGSCHTVPGVPGARGRLAVTLEDFGPRSYIAGRIPNGDEQLVRWIRDPAALVPGTAMPSMGVSSADARAIAAYLRSLR